MAQRLSVAPAIHQVVCRVLARHVERRVSELHARHHLERDLDLTPLELVLIAQEVEDLEDVTLPPEALAEIETVSDLLALASQAATRARRVRRSIHRASQAASRGA
jgi:acyl carrier protein